jgi:hypothetical protein
MDIDTSEERDKMPVMAQKKPNRSPAWHVNARLDPDLEACVRAYMQDPEREFEPTLAQVLEKALKVFLKQEGFWPPKPDPKK